ncbi:hypothetical protein PA7_05430 [Pseudonocardia asaccharolytica DSM 44247 = NBRC 16224]|uniref:Uncharacterized protein n=1 Tax=Pseudonocardia asaccharolytica DSM 44247 = NBRC 16224 TaxID=1123024 RepID=A0A511CVV8_9PSEU|nr:hypothetical protein PA7_05430 [Pseudonocardia asaccharolytica DSM 44247 = NBRC 16224]
MRGRGRGVRIYCGKADRRWPRCSYESCARAEEILTLDIEDLAPADKRARVIAKGGATEWIRWQSGTAQLLPCLLGGRIRGPVLLTQPRGSAGGGVRTVR